MKEKLWKNDKNEYLWLFTFIPEGFNDVWAKNKKEAIKKAIKEFPSMKINPQSFKKATRTEWQKQNELGWRLFD